MDTQANARDTLFAMPAPFELSKLTVAGEMVVSFGPRAVFVFDENDRAMRNLSIIALRRAGVSGIEVARLFELSPEHISRLCQRVKEQGSAGLVAEIGRPRSLDTAGVARAHALSDAGRSGAEIARELRVSEATISRFLARRPRPKVVQLEFAEAPRDGEAVSDDAVETFSGDESQVEVAEVEPDEGNEEATSSRLAAISEGVVESRYAGAAAARLPRSCGGRRGARGTSGSRCPGL